MSRMRIATGAGLSLGSGVRIGGTRRTRPRTSWSTRQLTPRRKRCRTTAARRSAATSARCARRPLKANADTGQDTIVFAVGPDGIDQSRRGAQLLSLTEGVQITHTGDPSALSISGQHTDTNAGVRLFDVNATTAGQTVSIEGLTLRQGSGIYGGAVYVHNPNPATLDLTNDVLTDNHTIGGGGAVYSYRQVNVQSSTVSDNINNSGGFVAGAISAKFGLSVVRLHCRRQLLEHSGRGRSLRRGMSRSHARRSIRTARTSNGGAIELTGDTAGTAEITDSTFTTNFGNSGGAIHLKTALRT